MSGERTYNVKAIIGFCFSLIALFIPIFGVPIGIGGITLTRIAIAEIDQTHQQGVGLAKTGFFLGIAAVIVHTGLLIAGLMSIWTL
ncbi:hypothetical protein ACFO4L_01185 [Bacillus daqingensis]|uniref:DUF4190 domain-containing protein n=1 Tax=Bacillus daqingensis TaxID=872396 RepID=A0ABV9NT99_9BACI